MLQHVENSIFCFFCNPASVLITLLSTLVSMMYLVSSAQPVSIHSRTNWNIVFWIKDGTLSKMANIFVIKSSDIIPCLSGDQFMFIIRQLTSSTMWSTVFGLNELKLDKIQWFTQTASNNSLFRDLKFLQLKKSKILSKNWLKHT